MARTIDDLSFPVLEMTATNTALSEWFNFEYMPDLHDPERPWAE